MQVRVWPCCGCVGGAAPNPTMCVLMFCVAISAGLSTPSFEPPAKYFATLAVSCSFSLAAFCCCLANVWCSAPLSPASLFDPLLPLSSVCCLRTATPRWLI